jgi:hypothetical protein
VILGTQRVPKPISAGSIVGSIGDRDRRAGVASTIDLAGIALFTATLVAVLLYLMHPQPGNWYLLVLTAAAGGGARLGHRLGPPGAGICPARDQGCGALAAQAGSQPDHRSRPSLPPGFDGRGCRDWDEPQ